VRSNPPRELCRWWNLSRDFWVWTSHQIRGGWAQDRVGCGLGFHLLLQEAGGFFFQADVEGAVADEVAMAAGAAKGLKQDASWSLDFGFWGCFRFSHALGPQTSQCLGCCFQFIAGEVNREEGQDEVKAICVAAEQYEIVVIAERREARFARFWHVPSPSKGNAPGKRELLQTACKNNVRLD
jgi:hypothetical protein